MGKRRTIVEITLKDKRMFITSLKKSQSDVLNFINRDASQGITKLEIAEALNPEEWRQFLINTSTP